MKRYHQTYWPLGRLPMVALLIPICAALAACGGAPAVQAPVEQPAPPAQSAAPEQPAPPALAALAGRSKPCDTLAQPAPASDAAPSAALVAGAVHYDDATNTIVLRNGAETTLPGVLQALGQAKGLQQLAPGEWLLDANLKIEAGARLRIAAPEVRWLKLRSDDTTFVWVKALGGQLELRDICLSSWDVAKNQYDANYQQGRSFVLARDGGRLDIERSDVRYLGYDGPEAYGLAWRLPGTTGQIVDSFVSHNFYGVYSFQVDDLLIKGNETDHNVMYGIDPHTKSMRLVIENNVSHDNGKHGIILAEECSDAIVRNNVAYNNLHHGIVIYQRSDNNLVEGNTAYGNGGHGINVNDSAGTIVRGNTVYDNLEAGIGVGQGAKAIQLIANQIRANRRDGISLYSEAQDTLLRENVVAQNSRFGIYVKSPGKLTAEQNDVAGNLVGVYLNAAGSAVFSAQANRIHDNREADTRQDSDVATATEGTEP